MTTLLFICSKFFAIPFIVVVVGGLILPSKKSNMLRDEINDPVLFVQKLRASASIPRPFSLARTQLAFWTAIIASSNKYIPHVLSPLWHSHPFRCFCPGDAWN